MASSVDCPELKLVEPASSEQEEKELLTTISNPSQRDAQLQLTLDICNTNTGVLVSWCGEAKLLGCAIGQANAATDTYSNDDLVELAKCARVIEINSDFQMKVHANGFKELEVCYLQPATKHIFFIVSHSGGWDYKEIVTPYDAATIDKPSNMSCIQHIGKVFYMAWDPPASTTKPITGYVVSMKDLAVGGAKTETRSVGLEQAFTFTSLEIGKQYELAVYATDGVHRGPGVFTTVDAVSRKPRHKSGAVKPSTILIPYHCWMCGKALQHQSSLNSHIQSVHYAKAANIYCDYPECLAKTTKFSVFSSLCTHMKLSHGMKSPEQLRAFKLSRHGCLMKQEELKAVANKVVQDFPCGSCTKVCLSQSALEKHVQNKHKKLKREPDTFECAKCHVLFRNNTAIQLHYIELPSHQMHLT